MTRLIGCKGDDCSGTAPIELCSDKGGDTDGDGVCDQDDNCPIHANEDQGNLDGDAFGDVCDTCPLDADNDSDKDGLCADADLCPDTAIPEKTVPAHSLGVNRWALIDNDIGFDTKLPHGLQDRTSGANGVLSRTYTILQTRGCSCEQIVAKLKQSSMVKKFGCSKGTMDEFIEQFGSA